MGWLFPNRDLRMFAEHEAHHAAACVALGEKLVGVEISDRGGFTHNRDSAWMGSVMSNRSANLRYTLAGPWGQARFSRCSLEDALKWGGAENAKGSDFDWVKRLIRNDSLDTWASKTKRLLSGYGQGINDLVVALLDTKRVDGAQATRILNGKR